MSANPLTRRIAVLHLEDSPADAKLVAAALRADGLDVEIARVDAEAAFRQALETATFDLIISDYSLPSFDGGQALELAKQIAPGTPFIVVSGALGEELAVELLKTGATDYVLKNRLGRLSSSARRALNESEERARRERAEVEVRNLEEQLRHAQRMEGIGRLAGGIAHDFNNLLTVINGYASQVLRRLPAGHSLASLVEPIQQAGERAATLTQRLLAFSRRQVLAPRVVSLNAVVRDVKAILRPLVGENVTLEFDLDSALGLVLVDPGQMEHVIVNLATNARDAMPEGGTLSVKTSNVSLAPVPGETKGQSFVVLSVRDTGTGMDDDTRQHIFEPFFTTKASGHGTGLGLPTVYGIVAQSGGEIRVDSTVGAGSTFEIWLPTTDVQPAPDPVRRPDEQQAASALPGNETLLLVEDEPSVRELVQEFLSSAGYRVLVAGTTGEAREICQKDGARIDMMVSDVVLAGGNGVELAGELRRLIPGLRILFISGYPGDGAIRADLGAAFLAKPFSRSTLLARVREVLSGAALPLSR